MELKKQTKGLIGKEGTGVSWEGGRLAARLNMDATMTSAVMGFIELSDEIKVEPDRKNGAVRIVFSRPSEIKAGLIYGFQFNRNLLPPEAIEVMDKIAGLVR